MPEAIKFDMRDWSRTFEKYVSLRKQTRAELTQAKAKDFAIKTFQALPPTDRGRIQTELTTDKLLLKLTVRNLQKRGVQLKGLPSVKVRLPKGAGGGSRRMSGYNRLVSKEANKLLRARKKSSGYHRAAFAILARKLGWSRNIAVSPRSLLNKSAVTERHSAYNDVYTLSAVARGLDCPSTHAAREAALVASKADMNVYIQRKLDEARKRSGFK